MWQNELRALRLNSLLRGILCITWLWSMPLIAAATDIHWLWDDRCAECHGHSAEFARKFLAISDDQLQGRHHEQGLRLFLRNHYTPADNVDAIYQMLLAQVKTPPRYSAECSACHGGAASFIRGAMVLQEGALLSRSSKQSISNFMQSHRGLEPEDIEFYVKLLNRVAAEVYGE